MKYNIQTLWPQFHQETLCFWKQEQMLLPNTDKKIQITLFYELVLLKSSSLTAQMFDWLA